MTGRGQSANLSARFFPNGGARGRYHPFSLSVHVDFDHETHRQAFQGSPADRQKSLSETLPVIVHEYQHAIDHIGTRYGRGLVRATFEALNSVYLKRQGDVDALQALLRLHDILRRSFRDAYYTEIDHDFREYYDGNNPWRIEVTADQAYNLDGAPDPDNPILFARFHNHGGDHYFARQPITPATLMELRAVNAQLRTETYFHRAYGNRDRDRVFQHDTLDRIYDPQLTMYSAPAHLLANIADLRETGETYERGARLAWIALNMSPSDFTALVYPDYLTEVAGPALEALRRNEDVGFAFACLAWGAPKEEINTDHWAAGAVKAAGLRPEREIFDDAASMLLAVDPLTVSGPFDQTYRMIAGAGYQNAMALQRHAGAMWNEEFLEAPFQERLHLPRIVWRDGTITQAFGQPLLEDDFIKELFVYEPYLVHEMDDFVRACR